MTPSWSTVTMQAVQGLWEQIISFFPKLVFALILIILGWIIAIAIGRLVAEVLNKLKFNQIFEKTGWKESFEKAEMKTDPSQFMGLIAKWTVIIFFFTIVASDILKWSGFAEILKQILLWIPNLIIAIAILVVAIIIADILEKIVKATVKKMGASYVNLFGGVVKWSIYIFAVMAVLLQLGVTSMIINIIVIGFVSTITLALGLSFGLGGKDAAAKIVEDVRKKMEK